jgi:hypothetical protein
VAEDWDTLMNLGGGSHTMRGFLDKLLKKDHEMQEACFVWSLMCAVSVAASDFRTAW